VHARCMPTFSAKAAASRHLDIRLVYYRGMNECRAFGWIS